MGPVAAVREFIRMANAAGNGLEQAGQQIRDYNAALDRNTQARQANTEALLPRRPCPHCGGDLRNGRTHGRTDENGPVLCTSVNAENAAWLERLVSRTDG